MGSPQSAAVYCRISSDRSGQGLGVDRQEELCRSLADRKGWPVGEVYVDNDRSAYTGAPRPNYERLLTDLEQGVHDAVIVVDQDRLTRHVRELEDFIDLADRHSVALANVSGDLDLSSSDGRFRARIMGAVARQESEKKADRIRRQRASTAAKGLPHPGPRRFGFLDGNIEHHPSEADAIRSAVDRILSGESVRSIANEWNDTGVRTARGNQWSVNAVRDTIASPTVAGLRAHKGEVVGEGVWDPIVKRGAWEQLVAMFDGRKRQGRPATHLLSGIMTCSLCSAGVVCFTSRGTRTYRCHRQPTRAVEDPCGRLSIVADSADNWITAAVLHRLSSPALVDMVRQQAKGADSDRLVGQLREDEGRLETLARDYAAGEVSRAMFLRTSQRMEDRIETTTEAIARRSSAAALQGLPSNGDGLEAWWEQSSVDKHRAVLTAVFDRVDLLPADPERPRRFDPDRLEAVWRA